MKLLVETNRRYLVISLAALLISSGVLFLGIRRLFNEYSDERLTQLAEEITVFTSEHDSLPAFFQSTSARLIARRSDIRPVSYFGDTLIFNKIENENEPFRSRHFGLQIRNETYQVEILQSAVETEDIVEMVLVLYLALILITFIVLFWAQKRISERLWRPFYDTLERLRTFHLSQRDPLALLSTTTDEFAELNATLVKLTEKTRGDYLSLKRFTENASHEIQTPLAVIQAKLETLFQSKEMTDAQLAHLHSAQRAAARLSRLQQNLLLLVKIENDQFQQRETADLKRFVESRLELLDDFIVAKNLRVHAECIPVQCRVNLFLAETLIGNLLGNAVKHNLPAGGYINIILTETSLVITNSGPAPEMPVAKLTERFQRSSSQAEGLGLGLAIAQEICEENGWTMAIAFENGTWETSVKLMNVG